MFSKAISAQFSLACFFYIRSWNAKKKKPVKGLYLRTASVEFAQNWGEPKAGIWWEKKQLKNIWKQMDIFFPRGIQQRNGYDVVKSEKSVIQYQSSCISTRHLNLHHSGSSLRNGEKTWAHTLTYIENTTINIIESKIRLRNSPKLTTLMMFLFSPLTRAPQPIPLVVVASVHGSARGPPSDPKSLGVFLVFLDPKQ